MRWLSLVAAAVGLFPTVYGATCSSSSTCNLNVKCSLPLAQLSVGDATTCQQASTISPCSSCAGVGQQCYNAPECKDSLFYCEFLSAAQFAALPAGHPCLSTACQLSKQSPACIASTFQACCVPGTPGCNQTVAPSASSGCTPSGCSYFMGQPTITPNYSAIACPFADASATCATPQCNASSIFRQIVNVFAANIGCSGSFCIPALIPGVCAAGVNLTASTTASFPGCTNYLVDYCTKNPTDVGCHQVCPYNCNLQANCPCKSSACAAVNAAPLCVRNTGVCADFRKLFVNAMFTQRNFQPASDNMAYAKNRAGAAVTPFQWSANLTQALADCNALITGLGDNIASCVTTSFAYCNANPWDPACKTDLSVCGDGIVSWFETCDEGPNVTATGGCTACKTTLNWECYSQGTPCKRCLHQTGYVLDMPNPGVCPFCANLQTGNTWPCATTTPCAVTTTLPQKIACDNYVQKYCTGIQSNSSLRDPGCDSYVNLTKPFTVPSIPQACDVAIKTITINDPQLYALKFAVFNCAYGTALNSQTAPTTPLYSFTNPLDSMSLSTRNALSTAAFQAIVGVYGNKTSKLYSLQNLTLSDFSPYVNSSIVVNGLPLTFPSTIAQLTLFPGAPNAPSPQCGALPFDTPLMILPPSQHPLRWALKAYLTQLQYRAINGNDASLSNFAQLALDSLTTETTPKPGVFQAAVLLSQSTQNASGAILENKMQTCATVAGNQVCLDIQAAIDGRRAQLHFGKLLFDASCTDTSCSYAVDACRMVPLTNKLPTFNQNAVLATANDIVKHIGGLDDANSKAETLQRFLQIAVAAAHDAYSDTSMFFDQISITGPEPVVRKNVPNYCPTPKYSNAALLVLNPAWVSNPCCNPALALTTCCAPQDVPSGSIPVVKGFNTTLVSSFCAGTPANTISSYLNGAYATLQANQASISAINAAMNAVSWATLSSIQQVCLATIHGATSLACYSDLDCGAAICSKSTCLKNPATGAGTCSVPYDAMNRCMAECFGANMDPDVVRFAKAQWGLSPLSSASALATAFSTHASVPQCVGPYATLPGIGTTRQVYACNTTCQMGNLCDDGEYMSLLMSQAGAAINFTVNATCIANGGRLQCASYGANASTCARYSCTFDSITGACKDQTACMTTCMLPMTAGGCALANGTWYMDQYNRNQCCPPDAYYNATNTAFPCSYAPPTAPALAYTITDPTCCAAQNGTWFVSGGYGACCFGKLKSIQNGNAVQLACVTTVSSWDVASCLSSCSRHSAGCTSCKAAQQSAGCCNTTTVVANETACLAPTICTNQLVAAADCADPTPFCAKCAGNVCSSVTQWPSCTLAVRSSSACASAGGTWDAAAKVCNALVNATMVGTDCLRSDLCPNATDVDAFYAPFGVVPKYPRRAVTCQRGCYLPSLASPATCTATPNYKWLQDHGNGNGICMTVTTGANCDTLGGTFLNASRTFFPGAFTTSAMCAEGNCVGSPRVDGWSAAQCTAASSWASCTMACSTCAVPTSSPLAAQGSAACFSTDASYCTSLGYSTTPCMDLSANTTTACAALTSATWRTCSSYASASTCANTTDTYATMLGCRWTSGPCTDAVSCAAQGACNDGPDVRRKVCLDAGWTHGDTCMAKITTGLNQVTVATCSQCQTTTGVCVAPASGSGCATPEQVHPRGCRVDGVATATACATAGGSWVTPATTQSACVSTLGCLEPGATTLSMKNATQCTLCGGSLKPWYTWTSGVWAPAYVEAYTWQANGTTLVSANAYKPTLSLQLLGQVLQGPIAKRVARLQKTKALLQYNGMTDVLSKLACACGRSANSACFSTPASANATLTSQSQIFCGNSSTSIPTGTTSALVTLTCPSSLSARRRLDAASDGSAQLSVSTYSIASYTLALAPYCASQALNPLVLKSPGGLVYGQLLGPGQGVSMSGAFDNISLCLSIDPTVRQWPAFDTIDVALLNDAATMQPLNLTTFGLVDSTQVCFTARQNGVYFAVRRAAAAYANPSCPLSCGANTSLCVFNATTSAAECVCQCGYSGTLCTSGCPNSCSGQGTCYQNACYCNAGFTGVDCSNYYCPVDASGRPCSNNGLCVQGACVCSSNYQGAVCDTPQFALLNGSAPPDYASSYVAPAATGNPLPPSFYNTPSPTPLPTPSTSAPPVATTTTPPPTTTDTPRPTATKNAGALCAPGYFLLGLAFSAVLGYIV